MTLTEIDQLIENKQFDDAVKAVTEALPAALADDDKNLAEQLYLRRGRVYWRMNRRGPATTDYEHALALNPESKAAVLLDNARDVEDFFNPDLLNP